MALPLKTFWLYNRNIDRISAQQDVRRLNVARFAQATQEGVSEYRSALITEMGDVVVLEKTNPLAAERDATGLADLKRMAGQNIGDMT